MPTPVTAWATNMLQKALDRPGPRDPRAKPRPFARRPAPAAPAPPPPPAPQAAAFPYHIKTQYSGNDVRADRLVRAVRDELRDVRATIHELRDDRAEMMAIDLDAVRADPEAAASLPPAALVRALLEVAECNEAAQAEAAGTQDAFRQLQQENAWLQGRLHTFEETLGALHENLQDLRQLRDHSPHLSLLPGVAENGSEELPAPVRSAPRARKRPA